MCSWENKVLPSFLKGKIPQEKRFSDTWQALGKNKGAVSSLLTKENTES